jgi:hypothetical protein
LEVYTHEEDEYELFVTHGGCYETEKVNDFPPQYRMTPCGTGGQC